MVWGGALAGVVSGLHTFGVHHLRSVSLSVTDLCVRDNTHTCLGPRTSFLPVPSLHAHCSPVRFKPAAAASSQAIICEGHGLWWSEPQTLGPGCPGSKPSTAAHMLWDLRQAAQPRLSKDSVCCRGFSKEGKSSRPGTVPGTEKQLPVWRPFSSARYIPEIIVFLFIFGLRAVPSLSEMP